MQRDQTSPPGAWLQRGGSGGAEPEDAPSSSAFLVPALPCRHPEAAARSAPLPVPGPADQREGQTKHPDLTQDLPAPIPPLAPLSCNPEQRREHKFSLRAAHYSTNPRGPAAPPAPLGQSPLGPRPTHGPGPPGKTPPHAGRRQGCDSEQPRAPLRRAARQKEALGLPQGAGGGGDARLVRGGAAKRLLGP